MSNTSKKRCKSGLFSKGQSGNPAGRPKGSGSHETELLRLENDALKLASNTADVIAETLRLTLTKIGMTELMPLVSEITKAIKEAVKEGEIPPSSLSMLRVGFDDHKESGQGGAFFVHAGLPENCDWKTFKAHYKKRGRIDNARHIDDLASFPPIAEAVAEFKANAT